MNKIAAVSMVKNEEDIIESFVRHTCLFADKLFICDYRSIDRTREILESLKDEGLPIEISSYDRDDSIQTEVINNLVQQTIKDGFDLIFPLDTDEFVIYRNGDSKSLRKHLQQLDPNFSYRSDWWEHRFVEPEKDPDQFALNRPAVRSRIHQEVSHTNFKIIAGRDMLQKTGFRISLGNHDLEVPDKGEVWKVYPNHELIRRDPEIFHAHFSLRSRAQSVKKNFVGWLNFTSRGTRYCPFGEHWRNFVEDYLQNPDSIRIDLEDYVPAVELLPYRDECSLRVTGGGASILFEISTFTHKTSSKQSIANEFRLQRRSFGFFCSSMVTSRERFNRSIHVSSRRMNSKISLSLFSRQKISKI